MKTIISLILLVAVLALPVHPTTFIRGPVLAYPDSIVYLSEDFEGAGTPSGWAGTGTFSFDTSSGALFGTESATTSAAFSTTSYTHGSDIGSFWFFVAVYPGAGIAGTVIDFRNSSNVTQASLEFRSDRINISHGSASGNSIGASISAPGSMVWVEYIPSTGSNGILRLYVNKNSLSTTRPAVAATITTGTGGVVRQVRLMSPNSTSTYYFDRVRWTNYELGNNP